MKKTKEKKSNNIPFYKKIWRVIEGIFEGIGRFFLGQSEHFRLSIAFKITFTFILMLVVLSSILGPLIGPVGIPLIAVFGYRAVKYFLQPIEELTTKAQEISTSDLSARLDVRAAEDELRDLTITFNDMMKRLEHGIEEQKAFINHASHELRTPLSVIDGYGNLLDRWGKDDPAVRDEAIQAIKRESKSMRELVEKLLLISRMDHGTQNFEPTNFNVQDLIREVIEEAQLIREKTPTFKGLRNPVELEGDRLLIKEVLRNLINNAIQYTPLEGEIQVKATEQNERIFVTVRDSGKGISEEYIQSIFEPFVRADQSRDRGSGGTGLGLSIVKRIVELHHGHVNIASELGKGTLISLDFPKKQKLQRKSA
ncbi:sensor histidine kinase [Guggenheimella bovis]